MSERLKATPASYVLLKRGNEVLMHLRKNSGYMDGFYSLVAGHLEECEGATQCIIREAKEEAGVTIHRDKIKLAHTLYKPLQSGERIDFFYVCEEWDGEITNCECDKCEELKFFPMDNLPENTVPYVKKAIEKIAKNEHFSEYFLDDYLNAVKCKNK